MVILSWPKMRGERNIDSNKSLYHQEKCLNFDNSYQKTPLPRYNLSNINLICLTSIVGKLINQVDLNANFDKKWELCQLYLDNGMCWFELSKCKPFS